METKVGYITRIVKVDRKRSSQEALEATNRTLHLDNDAVDTMPNGINEEVEVVFFNLGRPVSKDDLMRQVSLRGLDLVDPYSLAAVNEAEPSFADEYPNVTQWKNTNGKWCLVVFAKWNKNHGPVVLVNGNNEYDWEGIYWFGCVRKPGVKIVSELVISFKEQVQKSTTPVIFIPDTIGGGPTDTTSVQKVSEIAEAFRTKLFEENIHVSMERDPADFREYYIDTL